MKTLKAFALALIGILFCGIALAQVAQDPCMRPSGMKSVAISTAATTLMVGVSTGNAVHICGYTMSVSGTTPTFQFEYGTKSSTDCDTGAVAMSGAMGTGVYSAGGGGTTLMESPVSKQVCIVTTGTPTVAGHLSYTLAPY